MFIEHHPILSFLIAFVFCIWLEERYG